MAPRTSDARMSFAAFVAVSLLTTVDSFSMPPATKRARLGRGLAFSREENGAYRAARRSTAPVAGLFSEDWMNRLGTATASRKLWALPRPAESLGPGSVVLAHPGSFDHYFLESLVLILEHGPDGTKGVLLNHETPWTVEDLAPDAKMAPFAANAVFLGGDAGRDTITMVHGASGRPLLGGLDEQAGEGDRLAQALGAPAARRVARARFGGTWLVRPLLSGEPCPHP